MHPVPAPEARLEVLEGPLEGTVVPLTAAETTLGREPGNDLVLLDAGVSRHHCVLRHTPDGAFHLVDLGSRNSTLVNDKAIREHALADGDTIQIGRSKIQFRQRTANQAETAINATGELGRSSIVMRAEDVRYLRQAPQLPADERTVRNLNALVRVSRAVQSARTPEELYHEALRLVLEVSAADRAALLLGDPAEGFDTTIALDRQQGFGRSLSPSRTVVEHVARNRVAVLSSDPGEDLLESAHSLVTRNVQAVLAAPMEAFQRFLGILYLESMSERSGFDENLLELITAVAGIIALAIENSNRIDSLAGENERLQADLDIRHDMIGQSPAMKQVVEAIGRAARTGSTVLITGESGTGKELVARAVHRNSDRRDKPFIAINCAAIPENLLESELFGHEKGAFTGAVAQKKGKLELAAGGTVFLDEIGEMAPLLQGKLLRVLQEREMERVGGTRPIKLDFRLIAATNRDLREEARTNRFRADLYYRLNVIAIRVPPLRERREDIPLLARHFAERYAAAVKRRVRAIAPKTMSLLARYDWPGNVRELENAIERAVVMGSSDQVLPEDLPETVLEQPAAPEAEEGAGLYEALREAKRQIIEKALADAGGNQAQAAALLGVHPNHVSRLLRSLEMKKPRR